MKIDLVYLWCNGDDPQWRGRRQRFLNGENISDIQTLCEGRIVDNSDLRYSLRSVERYAPWINHIYIVTDEQTPEWLDTSSGRVTIVNHKDLFDERYLPLYNSCALELGLHKIEGLSEHYLCANDDMMFGREVTPSFFFTADGRARSRFHERPLEQQPPHGTYDYTIYRVLQRMVEEYGGEYAALRPNHQIEPYLKSSVGECIEHFREWSCATLGNRFRSREDMQRHIFALFAIATGRGVRVAAKSKFGNLMQLIGSHVGLAQGFDYRYIDITSRKIERELWLYRPALLCFNDTEAVGDDDRARLKKLYEKLYPRKSQFEL